MERYNKITNKNPREIVLLKRQTLMPGENAVSVIILRIIHGMFRK